MNIYMHYSVGIMSVAMCVFGTNSANAIGSGGILNLVQHAVVTESHGRGTKDISQHYRVYVHPTEGSFVLIAEGSSVALGLDKNKRHAILFSVGDIKISEDKRIIDVPENIPYKVLPIMPHFNRTFASLSREDGSRIVVKVER